MKPLVVLLVLSSAGQTGAPNRTEQEFIGPNAPRECASEVAKYMEVIARSEETGVRRLGRTITAECRLVR